MSTESSAPKTPKTRHIFQNPGGAVLSMKEVAKHYRDVLKDVHGQASQGGGPFVTTFDPHAPLGDALLKAGPEFTLCQKCGLWEHGAENPFMTFQGSEDPLVTVVVDAVSAKEDHFNELAAGGTSAFLKRLFMDLKFDLSRVRWAPITRCAARSDGVPNYATKGRWCRHFLIQDLMRHPPKVIMPVGSAALGLLSHKSNAQDWSGRELVYRGWPDDWMTDPDYARPRKDPADPNQTVVGHPLFGPVPNTRITMVPVQAPRIVYATQNPQVIERWQSHVKHTLNCALNGAQPRVYDKPWWKISTNPDEIEEDLMELIDHPGTLVSYDTETNGVNPWVDGAAIVFMMFRWVSPVTGLPKSIGFPWQYAESPLREDLARLAPVVLQALYESVVVGHNVAFDVRFTAANVAGADLNRLADSAKYDTWHMAHVLRQASGTLGLEMIAYQWVPDMAGYEEDMTLLIELHRDTMHPEEGGHYAMCPLDKWESHLKPYVMGDVEVAYEACTQLVEKLGETERYEMPLAHPTERGRFRRFSPPDRAWAYENVVSPANRLLIKLMCRGMWVDTDELSRLEDIFPKKIYELRQQLREVDPTVLAWCEQKEATEPGWELDLENKTLLKECLFDILKLPVKRLTDAGKRLFGEDDAILKTLSREDAIKYAAMDKYTLNMMSVEHPQVRPLQTYRKVFKEYSSYVRPMRNLYTAGLDKRARKEVQHIARDGCVHASFLITGTRGGRVCVSKDTELDVFVDGTPVRAAISDLYKFSGKQVVTLTHTGRLRAIRRLFFKGYEEMFYVRTVSGREIKATSGHLLRTSQGWESIGSLTVGSRVRVDLQAKDWSYSDRRFICGPGADQETWSEGHVPSSWEKDMSKEQKDLWEEVPLQPQRTLQCEISPLTEREQKRETASIGDYSTRRVRKTRHGGPVSDYNCSEVRDNGVYCSAKYRRLRPSKNWSCAVVGKITDGGEDHSNRPDVPRVKRDISQVLAKQGGILHESLPVVSPAAGNGLVSEGLLCHSIFKVSPRKRGNGRGQLVNEQARSNACTGTDCGPHSVCEGVCVSWREKSRFCNRWNKHTGRSGRAVPRQRGKFEKRPVGGELRLQDPKVFSERSRRVGFSSGQENSRFGEDTVCEIRPIGLQEVWDVEVEGDHSYIANSFVHHNSCRGPNLQQLPREGLIKRVYTSRFKARGCIYQGDLSQIELRLLAAACGDPSMVDAYHRGIDLHALTHSKIYRKPYEECTNEFMEWLQANNRASDAKKVKEERKVAKCVDPDTLVSVNGKIIRIGDLHPGRKPDTFYPVCARYVQTNAGTSDIHHFYCNGEQDRLVICARQGLVVCSPVHRLMLDDGSLVMAKDLKKGDVLKPSAPLLAGDDLPQVDFNPVYVSGAKSGNFKIAVDTELAYFLGLFYGDGCSNAGSVMIATGGTKEYHRWQDLIAACVKRVFGVKPKVTRSVWTGVNHETGEVTGSYGTVMVGSRRISDILVQLGAVSKEDETSTSPRRRTLRLPTWMFNATREIKLSFIAGLIDTDGAVSKHGIASFCTKSWKLCQDVCVLMRSVGLSFSISPFWNGKYQRYYYDVDIAKRSSIKLKTYLRHPDKRPRLSIPKFEYRNEQPNVVKAIIPLDRGVLVDISIDEPSLYLVNGLVSHNTTNFLTGYGGGGFGLQTSLASQGIYMSLEECENILESFFDAYPSLRKYLSYYKSFILNSGAAVSLLGRVRLFEEVFGDNEEAKAKALRAGCNHLIQSTAAEIMMICLIAIEASMRYEGLESMLVSTVHDSLVVDAVRDELPRVHAISDEVLNNIPAVLKAVFGDDYDTSWMIVPLAGDAEAGPNMLDATKVGANPDWDRILSPVH